MIHQNILDSSESLDSSDHQNRMESMGISGNQRTMSTLILDEAQNQGRAFRPILCCAPHLHLIY